MRARRRSEVVPARLTQTQRILLDTAASMSRMSTSAFVALASMRAAREILAGRAPETLADPR